MQKLKFCIGVFSFVDAYDVINIVVERYVFTSHDVSQNVGDPLAEGTPRFHPHGNTQIQVRSVTPRQPQEVKVMRVDTQVPERSANVYFR